MTDREKDMHIAKWLGWKNVSTRLFPCEPMGRFGNNPDKIIPNFYTSNADAVTILPALVERGYWFTLQNNADRTFSFIVGTGIWQGWELYSPTARPTISSAIVEEVIALIEKEKGDD